MANQLTAGFATTATNAAAPSSVNWNYDVTGANLDFLDQGETITFTYTVTATDNNNATATDTVAFTITGTNDAPTVSATASDPSKFIEAASAPQNLTDSGTVSFDDVDTNDVIDISAALTPAGVVWSAGGTLDSTLVNSLTNGFSTTATNAAAPGSVNWNYDVTGVNLEFLGKDETIAFEYTVTATDSESATATDTVSFTITGTNDRPGISANGSGSTLTGSVTEDATANTVNGQANGFDVDNGATTAYSIEGGTSSTMATGTYGDLSINENTGAWTYTLNNNLAATNALSATSQGCSMLFN